MKSHYAGGRNWRSHADNDKPKGKSGIHIKPENEGKFTARAKRQGHSVQEQARLDLANPDVSPAVKKQANFARNAKGWKH